MVKGKELYDQGKYLYGVEILNKMIFAQQNNRSPKDLPVEQICARKIIG
jgi:alkyl sulfatase BDS1-like metallo-beta-lactamase superfamily hydrolase